MIRSTSSPRRLHFREPRLDHVRLLAALKIFAALPDVLLDVQNHVAKLVHKLRGQKFQQRQPEQQVNFDVFLLLRLAQRTLQQLRQQFAERLVESTGLALRNSMPER